MKKYFSISYPLSLILLVFAMASHARDINLDAIYLKESSSLLNSIMEKKLEAYQTTGAQLVDRNVIHAAWLNGFDIVYIKEVSGTNIVSLFNRVTMASTELVRIPGIITGARKSLDGKFLYIKKLTQRSEIPAGETIILNIPQRKTQSLTTVSPFIDFTLSPSGTSILFEERDNIIELMPEYMAKKVAFRRNQYSEFQGSNPTMLYLSPNRKSQLLINGSGGAYRAKLITAGSVVNFKGLSSSTEVHWIDNQRLLYRRGSVGNFTAILYDIVEKRERLLSSPSLNTNITYAPFPKVVSFLNDQMIHFYDHRLDATFATGIEGEDVDFSPDGIRFTALYLNRLFIVNRNQLKRSNDQLKKTARDLIGLYGKAQASAELHSNEFSATYVARKIALYRQFTNN